MLLKHIKTGYLMLTTGNEQGRERGGHGEMKRDIIQLDKQPDRKVSKDRMNKSLFLTTQIKRCIHPIYLVFQSKHVLM